MKNWCWRLPFLISAVVPTGCGVDPEDVTGSANQWLVRACPPSESVLGIDISSYQHDQGPIDWATVAKNRSFVIIKATESTTYANPYYAEDIAAARASGMIAGSYHFLRFNRDGASQADHFLSTIGGSVPRGDLPPMIDVEDVDYSPDISILGDWIDRVEQVTGRKPIIYSGNWYWDGYLGSPLGFGDHPIAWSSYTSACPTIPDDFSKLTIWQYLGDQGSTPGIRGACDQDRFYGSMADLKKLADCVPAFQGAPMGMNSQSYPIASQGAVKIELGATVTGWVQLKNTGSESWKPGVVWLAPIPRDQASELQAASWQNGHRISSVTEEVAPGSVGRFELNLTGRALGRSLLSLGWVAENATWFADPPSGGGPKDGYYAVEVEVVARTPGAAGASNGQGTGGSSGSSGDSTGPWRATTGGNDGAHLTGTSRASKQTSGAAGTIARPSPFETESSLAGNGAAGLAPIASLDADEAEAGCNCSARGRDRRGRLGMLALAIALLLRRSSSKPPVRTLGCL